MRSGLHQDVERLARRVDSKVDEVELLSIKKGQVSSLSEWRSALSKEICELRKEFSERRHEDSSDIMEGVLQNCRRFLQSSISKAQQESHPEVQTSSAHELQKLIFSR